MSTWKPIIVGVDASAESASAAAFAWELATRARAACYLIHGTRYVTDVPLMLPAEVPVNDLRETITAGALAEVRDALSPTVPVRALAHLDVRLGHPALVLRNAVKEHGAELVMLGGKQHAAPVRWFGGSTALHAVRTLDVPLWVVRGEPRGIGRVLVGIDLSYAAPPTLRMGKRIADLFDAELRVLHAAEFAPLLEEYAVPGDVNDYFDQAGRELNRLVDETLGEGVAERVLRIGSACPTVSTEATEWDADLVVAGSHGKGWVDRVLIGSTAERLLNRMPASILVVPIGAPPTAAPTPDRKPKLEEAANA